MISHTRGQEFSRRVAVAPSPLASILSQRALRSRLTADMRLTPTLITATALLFAACVPGGRQGGPLVEGDGGGGGGGPSDGGSRRDAGMLGLDALVVEPVHDECPSFGHNFEIPIIVDDSENTIARDPAAASFLVPLAEDRQLFSVN